MGLGLLDFSSNSSSYNYTVTTTQTDSGNTTISDTSTLDNVGNVTLNLGQQNDLSKWVPFVALGLMLVGLFK